MVLGLGRQGKLQKEISEALSFGGGSSSFSGYSTKLTNADFDNFPATVDTEPGEWKNLAYYVVGDQESARIGSKDSASSEVGEVYMDFQNGTPAAVNNVKVRLGYETRARRSSDPVFEYPIERLRETTPEDQIKLAPQAWGRAPSGRGKTARAQDRIFVNVLEQSGSVQTIDKSNSTLQIPVTKSQE